MFILCIHSTFHRFQQFSLPLCLLSYGMIHQVHAPPFLYLLKALTMLAMPSLLWVNVTAHWLASFLPSFQPCSTGPWLHFYCGSSNSPRTPYSFKCKPRLWGWLHSTSPPSTTQPFLFALVSHYNPAPTFNFSLFLAIPPTSELLGQLLCI